MKPSTPAETTPGRRGAPKSRIAGAWNGTLALMAGDSAVVCWLLHSFFSFTGLAHLPLLRLCLGSVGVALLARLLRWNQPPGDRWIPFLARGLLVTAAVAAVACPTGALLHLSLTLGECVWLGVASAALMLLLRLAYFGFRAAQPGHPLEVPRWIALGAAGVASIWPYYFDGGIGSGDAHWYATMLADFLTQLRAGIFPVWLGQSEFAFNGADSPLRFAPWFQYAGGLVDLLTCHALSFYAVKNALIAVNGMAGVFCAYACLRRMIPRRPGIATLLAVIYVLSPAYLAAVCLGDQYMTYLTLPFLPVVLHGLWLVLSRHDPAGDTWLAIGLAGLWLIHPPIAMWTTLAAGFCWLAACVSRGARGSDTLRVAWMAVLFLALGSFPFLSVLSIDNKLPSGGKGGSIAVEVAADFPGNFKPVDLRAPHMTTYQVGYAFLLVFALACIAWVAVRPRGFWPVMSVIVAIALVALPVPGINGPFWVHAPSWLVDINNLWPTQRVFGLWGGMMILAFVLVYGDDRLSRIRWLSGACIALLLCASAWSWHEARTYLSAIAYSRLPASLLSWRLDPKAATLTRYAYSSFAYMPPYASHGYMDPWFENRLLDRKDESILVANADTAAPLIHKEFGSSSPARLVSSGILSARLIPGSSAYNLTPRVTLKPGRRYALRFEFSSKDTVGQLVCDAGTLHRDYLLPDSGRGINGNLPARAFGALPTSSHILSFALVADKEAELQMVFISEGQIRIPEFNFARYWLYTFEPGDMAVVLTSLMPYRARVDTALPVYLETPRMWLRGYEAKVNGKAVPTVRSHQNLVMVPLEPGPSEVALDYRPPWWLSISFWLFALGWLALAALGLRRTCQRARTAPAA